MRRYIFALILCLPTLATAEQLFNTEFAHFEMRQDSDRGVRQKSEYYTEFSPEALPREEGYHTTFTRPDKWADRVIWLHLESVGSPYCLTINGGKIVENSDALTPTNIDITKYLREGENQIVLLKIKPSIISTIEPHATEPFRGSYMVAQPQAHIHDFEVSLNSIEGSQSARLDISVTLHNTFSQPQGLDIGYDIYSPEGKLLEFSVNRFEVGAHQTQEVTFSPTIYNTAPNRWSPENPKLYRVTLYTRRNGVITEYIPQNIAFTDVSYDGKRLYNFGNEIRIKTQRYNATSDKERARAELQALKSKGINTISPTHPQSKWLYDLCQELGVWVIEQPNINSTHEPLNKKVGGTPANNPSLVEEYLRRGRAAYYRSRDYDIILGYCLAGEESGNGYNLYKLYEWMKSVEPRRPIIYQSSMGEWNSDILE